MRASLMGYLACIQTLPYLHAHWKVRIKLNVKTFFIFYIILFSGQHAMLTATRLPKGTDVSFITEMIEVIIFQFFNYNLPFMNLYLQNINV